MNPAHVRKLKEAARWALTIALPVLFTFFTYWYWWVYVPAQPACR